MSDAPGCRVELVVNCYNEKGELISDIPRGSWKGMDRYSANNLTNDLVEAIVPAALAVSRKYNELGFGVDGLNPSPSALVIAEKGKSPKR